MKYVLMLLVFLLLIGQSIGQGVSIIKETFDNNNIGRIAFGNKMNNDSTDYGYENGKFIHENFRRTKGAIRWVTYNYGLSSAANTRYKASLIQLSGLNDYGYGIVFNAENWDNSITFSISANGYYIIIYRIAGITTNLSNGWVKSSLIKTGFNVINDLAVEKKGKNYEFFVNGVSVKSAIINLYKFTPNFGILSNGGMKVALESLEINQWVDRPDLVGFIKSGYTPMTSFPVASRPIPTISKKPESFRVVDNAFRGFYGIKDKEGYRIVDPVFRSAHIEDDFVIAGLDKANSTGVYDLKGNTIIQPIMKNIFVSKFKGTSYFICEAENGFRGLLDQHGKTILPLIYSYLDVISDGYIYAKQYNGWGVIDLNGIPQFTPGIFDDNQEFEKKSYRTSVLAKNGKIPVRAKPGDGGKMGLMDFKGNWALMPKYLTLSNADTNQNYIASIVKPGDSKRLVYGVIDQTGKEIITFKYSTIYTAGKNYVVAEGDDPFEYDLIKSNDLNKEDSWNKFLEGMDVKENRKWGLLGPKAEVLIPLNDVNNILVSSEPNILTIEQQKKDGNVRNLKYYSLFDMSKKLMINLSNYDGFIFDSTRLAGKPKQVHRLLYPNFDLGLINLAKAQKWGYVDKSGKVAIPFEYDFASAFGTNGTAIVKKGTEWFYINTAGKRIPDAEASEALLEKLLPPIRPGTL